MKKLLSLLMAAILLPAALGAMDLQPNQLILGHYTTDDVAIGNGWGKTFLTGVNPIATDLTADELALFQGSKIVAFRVGLAESAPVTRVFVMPLGTNGKPTGEVIEWACNVSDQGWNLIELETPYEINVPANCGLRIGFDYEQLTKDSKPISAVKVGTIYPTYIYRGSNWVNYGVNTTGNLSIQCIAENDNFPSYVVRTINLTCKKQVKTGDDLTFSFEAYNLGTVNIAPGELTFDVAIDGQVMKTFTNPVDLNSTHVIIREAVNTAGLTAGEHTLTVSATTLNGEPLEEPIVMTATFKNFDFGFTRQMHLVEQFTSTGCTYCPQGTNNIKGLTEMRDDIAWVAVHENMGNTDPYRTAQTDSITSLEGIDGYPEGTFDRTAGISSSSSIYAILTNLSPTTMSNFLDYVAESPSLATVFVNSTFDPATREAVITINGELTPDFDNTMGTNAKLTVYLTEDGLVAPQVSGGNDYVHNNVLRKALVSVKGVSIKRTSDTTYENVFTYNIPASWNADNMHVVAFISRPLRSGALTDLYVTNTNKRKLGEFDEPVVIIRGDVDGNEKVNIDDVTELINVLLSGTEPANPEAADCYPDGKINIDDVTSLINFLLSGNW